MVLSFVKPWTRLPGSDGSLSLVPSVDVVFATAADRLRLETFLVDSGADISMAPRRLCEELGLDWQAGEAINLKGISTKSECDVFARILEVELLVPEAGVALSIPICFADGDASQLLGREGFFDAFLVLFDKRRLTTRFELHDPPTAE